MNPLRVHAENYRSFRDLDLELPSGCCAVVGANGAGKSSIVNVVDLCLFGPTSRTLADYLSEDAFDEDLVLCLEFEHRGELYKVRRTYSPKGRGQTKVDFERLDYSDVVSGQVFEPLTRETAAATQSLIEETVGLSRETFRASAFLAQGDGAAFTEAQPRERKVILAEVLGLEIWEQLAGLAKGDRARIESEILTLNARSAGAGEELEQRPALEGRKADLAIEEGDLLADIARFEASRTDVTKQLTGAREAVAELKGAREVLATREAELQRVETRVGEIRAQEAGADALRDEGQQAAALGLKVPGLERELAGAREQLEQSRERGRLIAESERTRNEITAVDVQTKKLETKLNELRTAESPRCDRCGQELPDEARLRALESLVADAAALADKASTLRAEQAAILEQVDAIAVADLLLNPDAIEKELAVARDATARVREIEARLQRLDELKAEREQLEEGLPELRATVVEARTRVEQLATGQPDIGQLEQVFAEVELGLRNARTALEENQRQVARAEVELERLAKLAERVESERAQLVELQAELDVVLLAEKAYGRDGIPALILENAAIPQIELEANRILAELGTSFTVELHTQRALKGGGLAEALDIVVCSEGGAARPYETFSGGERTRLNLALRIALARLLANRRGAEVRLLVIDEPEFLDEAGVARLAEVLRGLTEFERIFLISHQPALRDAFDNVIEVVKGEDGRSRVEGAVEAEAVAAA